MMTVCHYALMRMLPLPDGDLPRPSTWCSTTPLVVEYARAVCAEVGGGYTS